MYSKSLTNVDTNRRCPDCGALLRKDGTRRRDVSSDCKTCAPKEERRTARSISSKGSTQGWEHRKGGK